MSPQPTLPILATLLVALLGCEGAEPEIAEDTGRAPTTSSAGPIDVVARDYSFVAPAQIPSGWITFRLVNEGQEHHFFLLNRLPEGKTIQDYGAEVGAPFDRVWDELSSGAVDKTEAGAMLGRLLPAWYADVEQLGGVGLVAPGRTAMATVQLEPGDYVMECYVKTRDGEFHSSLGMVLPITVSTAVSDGQSPTPDLEITLTNEEMVVEGEAAPGEHTVAVHFQEHPEVGLGNDVHLVRLNGSSVEEVVAWMDWMNVDGLRAPAPAPFVGGTQEMPVGETAYFTVTLQPGRYAWVSETGAERLVREFSVE